MSVTLHGAVVLSVFGLPHIHRDGQIEDVPMVVELVTISNETNLLSQLVPDPEPQIQPDTKKDATKPGPAADTGSEVAASCATTGAEGCGRPAAPASFESKPEPKPKSQPKPVLKPEAKPQAPKAFAKAKPTRKPKPPDEFAAVLKNLAKEFNKPSPTEQPEKDKKAQPEQRDNFEQQIAKVLTRPRKRLCQQTNYDDRAARDD